MYAGNGATSDYQGLNALGKIAVVERSDAVQPAARARAAAAAGARALIVVNDGVGGLNEYVGSTSAIPVATVHRDAGATLISMAKSGAKLTLTQAKYTKFVYDLTREYPGQVPDAPLVYHPAKSDLARINARYYAVKPGAAAGYRYDVTLSPSLGFDELEHHPGTRVEWVTPGQKWVESHAQNIERCPALADGVGREVLPPAQADDAGLVRPGDPSRLQRLLRRLQLPVAELHDLERPGLELVQRPSWRWVASCHGARPRRTCTSTRARS